MSAQRSAIGVFIETYGCQMNVLDSELVQGQLESAGYVAAASVEDAGVVLINTCSVRDQAEHKVWSHLGRLAIIKREERPDLGLPEQITVFEWPRRVQMMREIGLWEHIERRLVEEGGPELAAECERAFQGALRAERIDLVAAIRGGEGYETIWESATASS